MNEYIDHTILKPDTTSEEILKLCNEAVQYNFASVCVAPTWVAKAKDCLLNDNIPVATVIGFPHGNIYDETKAELIGFTYDDGAVEHDIVIDVGKVKSGNWDTVEDEIIMVARAKENVWDDENSILIKYIVEVGYLSDEELFRIADLLIKHKIDYIKTCTGYGPRGVTVEDIVKIKKHVGDAIKIKASGGIKTADFAKQLIEAGANRIGCSASVSIMNEK